MNIPKTSLIIGVLWILCFCFAHADTYRLTIAQKTLDLIGEPQTVIVANDSLPAPTLHWREGEDVVIEVTNRLDGATSIHWHGILLPYRMDGVPGISFAGIEPGRTFTYRFRVAQSGTYWYHGHSAMQEQSGLYGALIIDPAKPPIPVERDYVVVLSDWPEDDPHRILARLKKQNDYYDFQKRTVADFFAGVSHEGLVETLNDRLDWGQMRMQPTDLADVTGATYHFLVNGQSPDSKGTFLFRPGERVRLRFINASAMTYFDVRIPGLTMRVIEADGQALKPVDVEEFRIAVAETYDILVEPKQDGAYAIFAEAADRSGFAAATLTPRADRKAELPHLRPRTLLTMADLGPAHGGHHASEPQVLSMNHSQHAGHTEAMPEFESAPQHSHLSHGQRAAASASAVQKVLKGQHLTAAVPNLEWQAADREITLRLTGNMNRYIWSFDDIKYSEAQPIRVRFGDRIRFNYVNETMMNHPIHLHGMWQYPDLGKGVSNPKKHVINVAPGKTTSVVVIADNLGEWAFHCHLLYHMESGMFRKVIVEKKE
ncbi:MAG: copper resistance system multicopper oxidase [Methylococcales bacterium]